MKRIALLAFTGLGLYAADPRWLRLTSAHFEMYTTANERDAKETLKYFEVVRGFFQQGMGNIPGKPTPLRIVAFNSQKEYEPYSPNSFTRAFFHTSGTNEEIVLSEVGFDAFPVAVHEYVHLVTRHMGMKLPAWLDEGISELYATLKPMGDRVLVGTLIEGRHQALLNDKWVPLKEIVEADHNSPYYNEKNQASSLYNEGWALTHMLVLTNEYRPGFPKFLEMINAGASTEEALQKAFGKSIAQVDKELQVYLRGTRFQGAYFALKLEKASDEIKVEPAATFDVKLVLADLLDRPGREQQMKAAYEELAKVDPKRPEPFATLGYLEWRTGNVVEAKKDFAKAFELGDRNPTMLWDYGKMLRGPDQKEAIHVLKELLLKEPQREDVRMELAAEQLTAQDPGAALDTLSPVSRVKPEDAPRLFGILAHAQLDTRQFDAAKESAEKWKQFARTDEEKFQADRILKFLEARADGGAPVSSLEPGRPRIRRQEPAKAAEPVSDRKSVAGAFVMMDCSGQPPKIVVETAEGQKIFLVDDPNKVFGATVELTCGPQKKDRVRVDFIPANLAGVDGLLRGLQVEP